MEDRLDPIEDLGDLFVDRHYELDLFWDWVTHIPTRPNNSFALIGRRRTGKTAILTRLFNRLFYEQEAVLPVFITFEPFVGKTTRPLTFHSFAEHYFTSYFTSYLAFRYRKPALFENPDFDNLYGLAREMQDTLALQRFDQYKRGERNDVPFSFARWVIRLPMGIARFHKVPTAIIVDEFQVLTRVYDAQASYGNLDYVDLTDSFQKSVETRWAPLIVSGSAVSTLVDTALLGALQGRFHYLSTGPLTREYAHDLVFRLAEAYTVTATEKLAEAIWHLTGGYPYSIYSLMTSLCPARKRYPSLEALEEVLTFELIHSHGKLWKHYRGEFLKYSEQLNEGQVVKKVMFWATKYPEKQIDAEQIAQELDVDTGEVQNALHKLYEADIVDDIGWNLYQGPGDPMLRRYIGYNHRREIEKLGPAEAIKDWQEENKTLRGQLSDLKGHMAKVHVGAVMRMFDGREAGGESFFTQAGQVTLPVFETVERRKGAIIEGIPLEIDLIGEWDLADGAGRGAWLVQVRYTKKRMGIEPVRRFLAQVEAVARVYAYSRPTCWYICKGGFTSEAAAALQEAGVLYSDRAQFNKLANLFDFFGLPA